MVHIKRIIINKEDFPTQKYYPFNLPIYHRTKEISFNSPVTFFVGENGAGKSTLIEALARRSGIHIWRFEEGGRVVKNPYEKALHMCLGIQWSDGPVPGSFFAAEIFKHFSELLDEWANTDPGQLEYFGGESLMTMSHGQSLMAYFRNRYRIRGVYLMDEPETALSPKSQVELLRVIIEMSRAGHAQFIIATHSPILLACPEAVLFDFDCAPVKNIAYTDTAHYRIYRDFLNNPEEFVKGVEAGAS